MEIADYSDEEPSDEFMLGLAKLRYLGMNYRAIGGLIGRNQQWTANRLKPYEEIYRQTCINNLKKLMDSLVRHDPNYDFMIDPRVVTQQMCALLMGGEEIRSTLKQLANLKGTERD
jgi:hypothetical protein